MLASEIVKRPVITEKSMLLVEKENQYTFIVDKRANRIQIRKAIEELFEVEVVKVNVMNMKPKRKRVGRYEGFKSAEAKAVVTLAEGNSIEIFSS